jgi:hypothetical protein
MLYSVALSVIAEFCDVAQQCEHSDLAAPALGVLDKMHLLTFWTTKCVLFASLFLTL